MNSRVETHAVFQMTLAYAETASLMTMSTTLVVTQRRVPSSSIFFKFFNHVQMTNFPLRDASLNLRQRNLDHYLQKLSFLLSLFAFYPKLKKKNKASFELTRQK